MRNPSRPWHRNAVQKAVVYALMGALVLPVNFSAHAANHALTAVADVNTIDYVVNVDWDYDSPPTQANNPNQRLDRDYIMAVLRVAAQSIFTMTEGRHRIGNVFIYRNKQFGQNVNIQMINTDDRSAANVGGFGTRNATSLNHLSFQKSPESINALGKVIAHELGHYTYGLLDEYVEEGKALDPKDFGSPSGTDNPKNTIMNNHLGFVSLSTPTDYADPATRQTAQARVYATGTGLAGGSAWETLTRPADQDPAGARGYTRTFFEAFRGINPNTLQLTRPVDGFDAKLNFIFAPNPVFRDVLIVDRSLPADRFASLIQAAKALVSQAGANTQFAVVVSPGAAAPVLGYTASTIEGKAAIVSALDAITPDTASTFDGLAAFTQSLNLLAAVRQRGDMSTLHVLTGTEATLPVEAATSARTARVSVNPLGITGGSPAQGVQRREQARAQSAAGNVVNLTQLANQTGGSYNSAKNGAEAAKDLVRSAKETHAESYASIALDQSLPLAANAQFNSAFRVASAATDGQVRVELFFDPADAAKLQFSLVAPNGSVYSPTSLPSGISFDNDAKEGVVSFSIDKDVANRVGQWTARVRASAAMVDGIGLEASSDARIALSATVSGGSVGAAGNLAIRAVLGGEKSIRTAAVTAEVYDEAGSLVLANVALRDDGVSPDKRANDGEYTVSLADRLPPGEYSVLLKAQTNANSRIASLGALIKGARNEELPVELLTRYSDVSFTLESGASGVLAPVTPVPSVPPVTSTTPTVPTTPGTVTTTVPVATSTAPTPTPGTTLPVTTPSASATPGAPSAPGATDDGGGCTVNARGRDGSLVLLLMAALAGWALRRPRKHANAGSSAGNQVV